MSGGHALKSTEIGAETFQNGIHVGKVGVTLYVLLCQCIG